MDDVRAVLRYHTRSTHHPGRFAPSLGYLDWTSQPDPFRTYAGAPAVDLPLSARHVAARWVDLEAPGAVPSRPVDIDALGSLLELSLGLSAWKAYGATRWALRCNPSSGNLHPTEGYLVAGDAPGIEAGVYHYVSRDHVLERRCAAEGGATASVLGGALLLGLSSIHWREAWKYGERAFRYCQHDAGHAIAAVRYAAAALGWRVYLLPGAADADVARLLGLNRPEAGEALEREAPEALLLLVPGHGSAPTDGGAGLAARLADVAAQGRWTGRANRLSPDHVRWEAIETAAAAAAKPATVEAPWAPPPGPPAVPRPGEAAGAAVALIRRRRSATALDGVTSISAAAFLAMLDRLLPRPGAPPWDAVPWAPRVHPLLFVHRVDGLEPGLYLLPRREGAVEALRGALAGTPEWTPVAGAPPLLRLATGDYRDTAAIVSCQQAIAADGAFAVAMLGELGETLRSEGAWWYRRLHWEAGVLGHVLYLEAEAAGVRGTGIGCFFDDLVHDLLGVADDRIRTLYHFTLGGPVEDTRLTTIPPYAHLPEARRG
jgi:SagB-type dehydrogenase family enzyme